MRRAILAGVLTTWALVGCATRPAEREADPDPAVVVGRVDADGNFRADTLRGAVPDTARVERRTVTAGTIRPAAPATTTGWRVQVFADTDREAAEAFARRVESIAGDEPVYVEWAEPWWKVRVGDFRRVEAAERLRDRLAAEGLDDAWTVRTTVRAEP
ncbi:MAG: SPOR domain-containing protein [Gemmatimonadota bacterium]|nr:SPOR domain-containing protein [Gemmatimonadota bacterium]